MSEDQKSEEPGPTVEPFRDGWVVVDRSGAIQTPRPLSEPRARAYARVMGIPFPVGAREGRRG